MNRRECLKSMGIATGVLAVGGASGTTAAESQTGGGRVTTADDLIQLSPDELIELPNADIRRPFNPEIGGGDAYDADEFEGAEGRPHGGTVTADDADYTVDNAADLKEAVESASASEVVWVDGDAEIDMNGTRCFPNGGITIASDRGQNGSDGGLLYQDVNSANYFFNTQGDGIRFTGLRFSGPEHEYWDLEDKGIGSIYDVGITWAITINDDDDIEIDNCTFSGFTYTGVRVGMWGEYLCERIYIHHCDFTDNPSPSLGYGVNIWGGNPLIEYNYLDNNRRSIAGTGGDLPMNYIARNNLFGPRTRLAPIDVHGGDTADMTFPQAGVRVSVDNNVVLSQKGVKSGSPQPSVVIRGVPRERIFIRRNWFFTHRTPPFSCDEGTGDGGAAIRQWHTDEVGYRGIEADNNIIGRLHPVDELGLSETTWDPIKSNSST